MGFTIPGLRRGKRQTDGEAGADHQTNKDMNAKSLVSCVFNERGLKVIERSKTKNTKLRTSGLVTEGEWGQTEV